MHANIFFIITDYVIMAGILGKRKSTFGIKVSEIPIGINEDDLKSMFNPFGSIASVHIKIPSH